MRLIIKHCRGKECLPHRAASSVATGMERWRYVCFRWWGDRTDAPWRLSDVTGRRPLWSAKFLNAGQDCSLFQTKLGFGLIFETGFQKTLVLTGCPACNRWHKYSACLIRAFAFRLGGLSCRYNGRAVTWTRPTVECAEREATKSWDATSIARAKAVANDALAI